MKHKHVKQIIARGIHVLQDLMVKLDPAMKPEQAEWQKKALAIFAKQNDAIVQASAAEMREVGANEALIDDMVSQLRKELEPDEPENGDEDETAPRAQPFPMSAVPGWQEVLGCDGMRLFEEQDLEGTFKPEEIVLDNISMQNFEGGADFLFKQLPPSTRRKLLFRAEVDTAPFEKKIATTSRTGDGSTARRLTILMILLFNILLFCTCIT